MNTRRGEGKVTAIMEAVAANDDALVAFLMDTGVDLNLRNRRGRTAFDIAQAAGRPHLLALLDRNSTEDMVPYNIVKLMLLGDAMAGKSSLVKALSHATDRGRATFVADISRFRASLKGTATECRTVGIDISTLQLRSSTGASFTLLVFDTAGHN